MLQNKKVLIGISGGIAAYKIALLVRELIKDGAEVKVVMTPSSKQFIGPVTLSTLSKNPVVIDFVNSEDSSWNSHVELALWCDLMVIAPATSNTIAKMATGICDNALLATYLSAKSPVFVAPAMDLDMAEHPTLHKNLKTLEENGVSVIPYEEGELASGLSGKGRMAEVETIKGHIRSFFSNDSPFNGKKFLVNAGPTHEAIDPVRFIGNRSTGKMGVAIANALASIGADVILVLGPTGFDHRLQSGVNIIAVETAKEMFDHCTSIFPSCDGAVLTAAVADYTPAEISDQKIKKTSNNLKLDLVKTPDTLAALGEIKSSDQLLVGFALETQKELEHAKEKLKRKNLDMIIMNSLNDKGAGFGHDTNKITAILKSGEVRTFELKKKSEVASDIVELMTSLISP
jgi:phosphopantothenoylcysteine decarboxylase / phosphopantothenate---cysteine ligase